MGNSSSVVPINPRTISTHTCYRVPTINYLVPCEGSAGPIRRIERRAVHVVGGDPGAVGALREGVTRFSHRTASIRPVVGSVQVAQNSGQFQHFVIGSAVRLYDRQRRFDTGQ